MHVQLYHENFTQYMPRVLLCQWLGQEISLLLVLGK
jgi:hypothetical protein